MLIIEQEIRDMKSSELEKLLSEIKFPLSGLAIGEGSAFHLLAKIEAIAITEVQRRKTVDEKLEALKKEDTRPRHKKYLTNEIIKEEISKHGVHLVAEWEDGGSDALDLSIFTAQELVDIFPEVEMKDAKAFFEGDIDILLLRTWKDKGLTVFDWAHHPINICHDGTIDYYED